ncbi:MAG: hypothetical protein KC468_11715 [Myxococcales bacterium]|nr:hypothetical protein [Myxococcales bacterium]
MRTQLKTGLLGCTGVALALFTIAGCGDSDNTSTSSGTETETEGTDPGTSAGSNSTPATATETGGNTMSGSDTDGQTTGSATDMTTDSTAGPTTATESTDGTSTDSTTEDVTVSSTDPTTGPTCEDMCDGVCVNGECCDPDTVCGDSCCGGDEVCAFQQCVVPGGDCVTGSGCADGEYCDDSPRLVQATEMIAIFRTRGPRSRSAPRRLLEAWCARAPRRERAARLQRASGRRERLVAPGPTRPQGAARTRRAAPSGRGRGARLGVPWPNALGQGRVITAAG